MSRNKSRELFTASHFLVDTYVMHEEEQEEPYFTDNVKMRIVEVMECVPGHRDNGDPITMLTLSHKGDIEPTMMLTYRDSERMLGDLLVSLSTHGHKKAIELLDLFDEERED